MDCSRGQRYAWNLCPKDIVSIEDRKGEIALNLEPACLPRLAIKYLLLVYLLSTVRQMTFMIGMTKLRILHGLKSSPSRFLNSEHLKTDPVIRPGTIERAQHRPRPLVNSLTMCTRHCWWTDNLSRPTTSYCSSGDVVNFEDTFLPRYFSTSKTAAGP